MANALGQQIINIFGDSALQGLGQTTTGVTTYGTDISTLNQPVGANSTVTVKTFNTAGGYDYNGTYQSTDITGSDSIVTLNRHKVVQREFTQDQISSPYFLTELAAVGVEMGQSLGELITADFFSLFNSGSFTNYTIVNSASFGRNTLNSIAATLSKRGVQKDNRTAILNNDYYNYLANDGSVVTLTSMNPDVVANINLPKLGTFQPYEMGNTLFPQNPYSGSYNVVGVLGNKNGVVFATRPVKTLGEWGTAATYGQAINKQTGLGMTTTVLGDPLTTGKVILRGESAYGFSVGNAKAIQLLIA